MRVCFSVRAARGGAREIVRAQVGSVIKVISV